MNRAVSNFLMMDSPTDTDRQNLITMLSERTGISQQEATDTVARWETSFAELRTNAAALATRARRGC